VGETGEVGDIEESRDADVTELFDLSTCQWLPLPSVSSDPNEISAMIPLSEAKTIEVYTCTQTSICTSVTKQDWEGHSP
jgi:ferritin-like protein